MYEHLRELKASQQQVNQLQAELDRKDAQTHEALSRAAERAGIDKERAVLAVQREAMDEKVRFQEAFSG